MLEAARDVLELGACDVAGVGAVVASLADVADCVVEVCAGCCVVAEVDMGASVADVVVSAVDVGTVLTAAGVVMSAADVAVLEADAADCA